MADIALAGRLFVPHYVLPLERHVLSAANLKAAPREDADDYGDLDAGASFFLIDVIGEWAWGYRGSDHLVGYVRAANLTGE